VVEEKEVCEPHGGAQVVENMAHAIAWTKTLCTTLDPTWFFLACEAIGTLYRVHIRIFFLPGPS
jgi:hypothetical protein